MAKETRKSRKAGNKARPRKSQNSTPQNTPFNVPESYEVKFGENTTFDVIIPGIGKIHMTGKEIVQLAKYKEEINSLHKKLSEREAELSKLKEKPIPSIPTRTEAELIEFRNQYDRAIEQANKVITQAGAPGNWDANEYLFGMFNGMELILSIFEERKVNYRDRPEQFLSEANRKMMAPGEYTKKFIDTVLQNYEQSIPLILTTVNGTLLDFVRMNAEQATEKSDIMKKRLEESLSAIQIATGKRH